MARPRRIVCYAINGAGMGHITRLLGIARWMRRFVTVLDQRPPEILFLSSSDASDMLADARFAAFKIPSKTIARMAGLDKLEYRRLAKQFVWQMLGLFSPDLLVVDTFPAGSFDELFQVLDGPFKKAFVGRCVKEEFAARPTFRSALRLYDTVVIPHRPNSWSAELCQRQLPGITPHYTGEVVQFDREELPQRSEIRKELELGPADRLIYVSAGGGGDPDSPQRLHDFIEVLLDDPSNRILVGAGPLYRGRRRLGPRIHWSTSPNVWRYFAGCDGAISAAGYNSFHELLSLGIPSLFYAQEKIADDQSKRIADAVHQNACLVLENPQNLEELRTKVARLADPHFVEHARRWGPDQVGIQGAREAARHLLSPLYSTEQLDWCMQTLSPCLVHSIEGYERFRRSPHTAEQSDLGSSTWLADWIVPLYPLGCFDDLASQRALANVLPQLSPAAAEELQQALQQTTGTRDRQRIATRLVELLRLVHELDDTGDLAIEMQRTLLATIKKFSYLLKPMRISWAEWIDSILCGFIELSRREWEFSLTDILRLFRMFPKIGESQTLSESISLFTLYIDERVAKGIPMHEMMHHLQVLKVGQPTMTRDRLFSSGGTWK